MSISIIAKMIMDPFFSSSNIAERYNGLGIRKTVVKLYWKLYQKFQMFIHETSQLKCILTKHESNRQLKSN
jgi:hypothetical protein